jgi:hypothetical protein
MPPCDGINQIENGGQQAEVVIVGAELPTPQG